MAEILGLVFTDLPENSLPIQGVLVVEYLDTDGNRTLRVTNTEQMPPWAVSGLLLAGLDCTRDEIREQWSDVGADDD